MDNSPGMGMNGDLGDVDDDKQFLGSNLKRSNSAKQISVKTTPVDYESQQSKLVNIQWKELFTGPSAIEVKDIPLLQDPQIPKKEGHVRFVCMSDTHVAKDWN